MTKVTNIPSRLHSVEQGNIVAGANEVYDDTKGKKQNVINSETDAELLRLEQTKQDNLTFDNAPTENSNNPVKSGGVYAADLALQQAIEAILLLIPSAATSLNQLADKAFVNSSISTATATFRGTYNVVTDLHLAVDATHAQIETALTSVVATADNNDYCYVQIPVSSSSQDIQKTSRYKFNGTAWVFEYDLNTSGFTSAQWAAINSGITAALVTKLGDLPYASELSDDLQGLSTAIQGILDLIPSAAASSNKLTDKAYVDGLIQAISALIPAEATDQNQLADKAYVLAQILAATPAFKGQFTTFAALEAVSSPKAGDIGIVRTTDNDGFAVFTFYQYLNNQWNVYYTLAHHLQNKPVTTGTTGDYPYNGMGRVVIPKNMVSNVNTLTQDAFEDGDGNPLTNTIFVIQYDFVLSEDITIPANCVLEFDGGNVSLGNYNISGSTNNEYLTPENFGAKGDGVTDDRKAIQTAINLAKTVILNGDYLVGNAPFDYTNYNPIPEDELDYFRDVLAQKNRTPDSALIPITIGSQKTIIIRGRVKAYSPLTNLFEINGDNSIIKGGGTIEGCGIVNSVNVYSGTPAYAVTGWAAANIFIQGSNNIIENITIKNPTSQGVNIYGYASKHNIIQNCTFGGGLINHTENTADCSFTSLFGIYSRGQGTVIQNNIFKRIDGKTVYDSLYCNYTDAGSIPDIQSRDIPHTIYENNIVEEVLEHGIYSYAQRLIIKNNTFKICHGTVLQLFNGYNLVENNIINVYTIQFYNNAIMVSGEHQTIRGNKIYNCTGYGIRCQGYYNGSCDYDIVENNYIEVDMNGQFSADNTDHNPTITFESSAFQENKVIIDKVTCRNNTIVCSNPAHGRNTPIRGMIAVYGDVSSTFKCIDILNNTITGTCAQNLVYIQLSNTTRESYANIIGNTCLAGGVLTAGTRYDCVVGALGLKKVNIENNQIKHMSAYEGLENAGYILELDNDFNLIYDNDMRGQALANRNWLNASGKIEIGYDNIVGGNMLEQIITISNGSNYTNMSFQHGVNVPFYVNIIPLNEYAKDLEATDPCKMISIATDYISIGHTNNVTQDAIYKVQVVFYIV